MKQSSDLSFPRNTWLYVIRSEKSQYNHAHLHYLIKPGWCQFSLVVLLIQCSFVIQMCCSVQHKKPLLFKGVAQKGVWGMQRLTGLMWNTEISVSLKPKCIQGQSRFRRSWEQTQHAIQIQSVWNAMHGENYSWWGQAWRTIQVRLQSRLEEEKTKNYFRCLFVTWTVRF